MLLIYVKGFYSGVGKNDWRVGKKKGKKQRTYVMSQIKSKGTKLENEFSDILRQYTDKPFLRNVNKIKGSPDIVFEDDRICIFIDSDFWHGWQFPRWKQRMKNEYWAEKITRNRKRDRNTTRFLRRKGWTVIRIWEHNLKKDKNKEIKRILNFISD